LRESADTSFSEPLEVLGPGAKLAAGGKARRTLLRAGDSPVPSERRRTFVTTKRARAFCRAYLLRLQRDRATAAAYGVAYAFLFSLFPFLIFAVTVLAYADLRSEDVLSALSRYVTSPLRDAVQDAVQNVLRRPNGGLLSFGAAVALVSASRAANQAVFAINEAYETSPDRPFWKARLLALAITLLMVLVLPLSFLAPASGWVLKRLSSALGLSPAFLEFWRVGRWLLSLLLNTGGLFVIYYLAPNLRLRAREALPGALVAALGAHVVSYGFWVYLSNFGNYSPIYGSLGGVMALMAWFYLIGLFLILGAELNAQLHSRRW
jgi:membrane protein